MLVRILCNTYWMSPPHTRFSKPKKTSVNHTRNTHTHTHTHISRLQFLPADHGSSGGGVMRAWTLVQRTFEPFLFTRVRAAWGGGQWGMYVCVCVCV